VSDPLRLHLAELTAAVSRLERSPLLAQPAQAKAIAQYALLLSAELVTQVQDLQRRLTNIEERF